MACVHVRMNAWARVRTYLPFALSESKQEVFLFGVDFFVIQQSCVYARTHECTCESASVCGSVRSEGSCRVDLLSDRPDCMMMLSRYFFMLCEDGQLNEANQNQTERMHNSTHANRIFSQVQRLQIRHVLHDRDHPLKSQCQRDCIICLPLKPLTENCTRTRHHTCGALVSTLLIHTGLRPLHAASHMSIIRTPPHHSHFNLLSYTERVERDAVARQIQFTQALAITRDAVYVTCECCLDAKMCGKCGYAQSHNTWRERSWHAQKAC